MAGDGLHLADRLRAKGARATAGLRRWGFPALLLVPLTALVAVLPLIVRGCSCGHDFDFHLLSWMEAAQQFHDGIWHLHWAYSAAWNAGEPRFVFYPPLSWTLGGWLGLVMPRAAVPVVYTWMALTAAGLGMYGLALGLLQSEAREQVGPHAAVLVAMAYVVNPYMLFTAYERTAYAELLAAAWIPLLLAGVLRARVTVLGVAVPVALLWLTNAPAAVMGCYALAVVGLIRLVSVWRQSGGGSRTAAAMALRLAAGVALGLALAAYFVVPAAYERRWVEIAMAMVPGMRIGDSFLFGHTNDPAHDAVLSIASWIAVAMLAACGVGLVAAWGASKGNAGRSHAAADGNPRLRVASLTVLTVVIAGMLMQVSAGFWRVLPEMQFLQFPWRLLALLAVVAGAAVAMALSRRRMRWGVVAAGGLVLAATMSFAGQRWFYQACEDGETVSGRAAVFAAKAGSEPTDEYTPKDADNDVLGQQDPASWLAASTDGAAPAGRAMAGRAAAAPMRFEVEAPRAEMLVLHLRAYPAWEVKVNGVATTAAGTRADGLLVVTVPAGRSVIQIAYRRTTDETVGIAISLVAAVVGLWLLWRQRTWFRLGRV